MYCLRVFHLLPYSSSSSSGPGPPITPLICGNNSYSNDVGYRAVLPSSNTIMTPSSERSADRIFRCAARSIARNIKHAIGLCLSSRRR
jgi:hypothetical protein